MSTATTAVTVLGAGSYGTALAICLARNGHQVTLWGRNSDDVATLAAERKNQRYLPDAPFPDTLTLEANLQHAVASSAIVLVVVPSHAFGDTLAQIKPALQEGAKVAWATKGLDFTGHGRSGHPRGGAYHPEYFLADADLALERIGEPCAVVGAGIGAYVALLLAGSRPDFIGAALLLAGEGLRGVGSRPDDEIAFEGIEGFDRFIARTSMNYVAGTDPLVAQCACDMRPVDYASSFAESARPMLFDERVGADPEGPPPAWWQVALEKNRGSHAPEAFSAALEALGSLAAEA